MVITKISLDCCLHTKGLKKIMDRDYIHGTNEQEQERLFTLNRLTNQSFINFLVL